jgi:hypothetical protein
MSKTKMLIVNTVWTLYRVLFTAILLVMSAKGQSNALIADNHSLPVAPSVSTTPNAYSFPDGKQQFHNYLDSIIGPSAFIRAAIGAGIDQGKPAPPEWDSGATGYSEWYGFRYGMLLVSETTKYSLGAVMHEDVAYHRCLCSGFFPRTTHAVTSVFTAQTRSEGTVLSLPAIAAPYAGSFTAVNAWYPARYEPQDAARLGTMSFAFQAGGNMLREFFLRSH